MQEQDPLDELPAARHFPSKFLSTAAAEMSNILH
jgi:hypothetical protein